MPEVNGRLTCCECGCDLGDADDPYRDPDCPACMEREMEREIRDDVNSETNTTDLSMAALKLWGMEAQVDKAIEECLELCLVLQTARGIHRNTSNSLEYTARSLTDLIADEVADVEIMCTQLRAILGDSAVDRVKQKKQSRLWNMINADCNRLIGEINGCQAGNTGPRDTQPVFRYRALVSGGRGPDVWDKEVEISGPGMTIGQAVAAIEADLPGDSAVISIEQED